MRSARSFMVLFGVLFCIISNINLFGVTIELNEGGFPESEILEISDNL